jgi:branched-chain amino acid transport system permease protein
MTAHYFNVSPWWGLLFGFIFAIALGLLMGIPTLRLRADYLAIVTIATAEVIRLTVRSVRFKEFFNGSDGINGFADGFYASKGWLIGRINPQARYRFWRWEYTGREMRIMVVGWLLVGVISLGVWLLMRSPWGRILKGIREDEYAVRSLGKNVFWYKMQALLLGGVIGMIAGVVLAVSRGSVQPDNYSRDVTFYILTALVLGGVATISGSIVGPMIFWMVLAFAEQILIEASDATGRLRIGGVTIIQSTGQIGQFRFMLVGALLMVLMIFRPQGIFGNRQELALDGR